MDGACDGSTVGAFEGKDVGPFDGELVDGDDVGLLVVGEVVGSLVGE